MEKAKQAVNIPDLHSFSFIGDPGCDGLGTEIMSIFHLALRNASGDIILIGGDIVPNGSRQFYENVIHMVDGVSEKPVYMICGNHDTDDYENYFGEKNYFIYSDNLLLVVLDNSKRAFSEQALELLTLALKDYNRGTIVITFHIPPPNHFIKNSVSQDEWNKVLNIILPFKDNVKYILCSHIHSYFEDNVDGIKMIASGGGGARIEEVNGIVTPCNHWIEFFFDDQNTLQHKVRNVSLKDQPRNIPVEVKNAFSGAFANECGAHVLYRIFAEDAMKQGKKGVAKLFLAASDAEFYHARNHYYTMGAFKDTQGALVQSIEKEDFEISKFYKDCIELSGKMGDGLAVYAFHDAMEAEKVHKNLMEKALEALENGNDFSDARYFTCTSCGYTFSGTENPKRCPICGAPNDKIKEV